MRCIQLLLPKGRQWSCNAMFNNNIVDLIMHLQPKVKCNGGRVHSANCLTSV